MFDLNKPKDDVAWSPQDSEVTSTEGNYGSSAGNTPLQVQVHYTLFSTSGLKLIGILSFAQCQFMAFFQLGFFFKQKLDC